MSRIFVLFLFFALNNAEILPEYKSWCKTLSGPLNSSEPEILPTSHKFVDAQEQVVGEIPFFCKYSPGVPFSYLLCAIYVIACLLTAITGGVLYFKALVLKKEVKNVNDNNSNSKFASI